MKKQSARRPAPRPSRSAQLRTQPAAPNRPLPHSRWKAYSYLLVNVIVWGAAFVIIKPAFDFTTPYRFLFYRFLLAALLSLPFLWQYRRYTKPTFWPSIKSVICLELIGTSLALALVYEGLKRTSALEANLIVTTLPIFVTLGGVWLLKEKEERHEWFGLGVAFIATLWLTLEPAWSKGTALGWSLMGNLLVFGHNVANIFYFPLAKKYYRHLPKLFVSTLSFYVGLVTFFLLSLHEQSWSGFQLWQTIQLDMIHPDVWIASGYMAFFGSIIGLTAYIKGQDSIEASEATLFQYLEPLVYIPLAYFWTKDIIQTDQLIALAVILIGVAIAQKRSV